MNYFLQLRDAVGQRFSSGWSSAGSYKSSKSVKSNRSDKLVKKIIKRDKARNGAINKGYLTNGSQDSGRDQVNIHLFSFISFIKSDFNFYNFKRYFSSFLSVTEGLVIFPKILNSSLMFKFCPQPSISIQQPTMFRFFRKGYPWDWVGC